MLLTVTLAAEAAAVVFFFVLLINELKFLWSLNNKKSMNNGS